MDGISRKFIISVKNIVGF